MKWLDRLSRNFRFGIPNLMLYITAAMLAVFALDYVTTFSLNLYLQFDRESILAGEVWRVITFIVIPTTDNPLFLLFSLYFYYFIGTTLEREWGPDRFTLYYLFGVLGAIVAGCIAGGSTNEFLNLSLFFAFATLFPEFRLLLFFIIPVKIKWLAYLDAAYFLFQLIVGSWSTKAAILFSLLNYLLFFGPDLWSAIREKLRYAKSRRSFRRSMRQNRDMWR